MRQIKFRGLSIDSNEWIYGYYGIKGEGTDLEEHCIMVSTLQTSASIPFFYFTDIKVMPKTVGQFTGLKDINGIEIYEGDWIKCGYMAVIEWNNLDCCFISKYSHPDDLEKLLLCDLDDIEVVGNIHQADSFLPEYND